MDLLCQYLNVEQCRVFRDFPNLRGRKIGAVIMRPSFVFENYCNTTWSFITHNSSYIEHLYSLMRSHLGRA